jgi:hypothetical protein
MQRFSVLNHVVVIESMGLRRLKVIRFFWTGPKDLTNSELILMQCDFQTWVQNSLNWTDYCLITQSIDPSN